MQVSTGPSRTAFTIIELLIVIAIIGIFAGLLFPTLNRFMARARQVQCVNNVRQLGIGLHEFVSTITYIHSSGMLNMTKAINQLTSI
jgi:prepilin-type N-terminal cleavage/methylation domain-containing protein